MQTYVFGKENVGGFADVLSKYRSKTDKVVPISQVFMREDGMIQTKQMVSIDGSETGFMAKPTDWALTQMAEYTGIHSNYLHKMQEENANELMAQNFNYWFAKGGDKRLFRTFEGSLIGFLSNRYRAIDNYDIVTHTLAAAREITTQNGQEVQVLRPYLTETSMAVTLLTTDYVELEPGNEVERYRMGIHIRNSEVGKGAFSMKPLLMRTSCMNSNIFTENYYGGDGKRVDHFKFQRRHVGKALDVGDIWSQDTQILESATIRSQIKDVTRAAFSKEIAENRMRKLRELKGQKFAPIEERKEATKRILGLSEAESKAIWDNVAANTRYEFLQAVTNHAQSYYAADKNPERETELEELGGSLGSGNALWEAIEKETKRIEDKKA